MAAEGAGGAAIVGVAAGSTAATAATVVSGAQVAAVVAAAILILQKGDTDWIVQTLKPAHPELSEDELVAFARAEAERDIEFWRDLRSRLNRDIPKALASPKPEQAVDAVLARERGWIAAHHAASADRVEKAIERARVKRLSPQGAYWTLDPLVKNHTPGCVAMAMVGWWPWEVIDDFHPPVHNGCQCDLLTHDEARAKGLMGDTIPEVVNASAKLKAIRALEEAAGAEMRTTGMVALYPSPQLAEQLALAGGEEPESLHLTLAFLPDITGLDEARCLDAIRGWARQLSRPFAGEISGVGYFEGGPDGTVTYLSVDLPGLPAAREALVRTLQAAGAPPAQNHGFTPHMTLDYGTRRPKLDLPIAASFDTISLVWGDERTDIRLGSGDLQEFYERRYAKGTEWGGRFMPKRGGLAPSLRGEIRKLLDRVGKPETPAVGHGAARLQGELSPALASVLQAFPGHTRVSPGVRPGSFEELAADVVRDGRQIAKEQHAAYNLKSLQIDPEFPDTQGFRDFDGNVSIGPEAQMAITAAGELHGAMPDDLAAAVYHSYRATLHEASHAINPLPAEDAGDGANLALEEALTEEQAHLLTLDLLKQHGQYDVLRWRVRKPDDMRALGVYQPQRAALATLLDEAKVPLPARAKLLRQMKFSMTAAQRRSTLTALLAKGQGIAPKVADARVADVMGNSASVDPLGTGAEILRALNGADRRMEIHVGATVKVDAGSAGTYEGRVSDGGYDANGDWQVEVETTNADGTTNWRYPPAADITVVANEPRPRLSGGDKVTGTVAQGDLVEVENLDGTKMRGELRRVEQPDALGWKAEMIVGNEAYILRAPSINSIKRIKAAPNAAVTKGDTAPPAPPTPQLAWTMSPALPPLLGGTKPVKLTDVEGPDGFDARNYDDPVGALITKVRALPRDATLYLADGSEIDRGHVGDSSLIRRPDGSQRRYATVNRMARAETPAILARHGLGSPPSTERHDDTVAKGALSPALTPDAALLLAKAHPLAFPPKYAFRTEHADKAYKGKALYGDGLYLAMNDEDARQMQVDPNADWDAPEHITPPDRWAVDPSLKLLQIDNRDLPSEGGENVMAGNRLRDAVQAAGYDGIRIRDEGLNLGGDQLVLYPRPGHPAPLAVPTGLHTPALDASTPADLSAVRKIVKAAGLEPAQKNVSKQVVGYSSVAKQGFTLKRETEYRQKQNQPTGRIHLQMLPSAWKPDQEAIDRDLATATDALRAEGYAVEPGPKGSIFIGAQGLASPGLFGYSPFDDEGQAKMKAKLKAKGHTPQAIAQTEKLIDRWTHGSEEVKIEIARSLLKDNATGKALRERVALETAAANRLLKDKPKMKLYRMGSLDKPMMSTTTNSRGAQSIALFGQTPHFVPDHSGQMQRLLKRYDVLGGFIHEPGYAGEDEVALIDKRILSGDAKIVRRPKQEWGFFGGMRVPATKLEGQRVLDLGDLRERSPEATAVADMEDVMRKITYARDGDNAPAVTPGLSYYELGSRRANGTYGPDVSLGSEDVLKQMQVIKPDLDREAALKEIGRLGIQADRTSRQVGNGTLDSSEEVDPLGGLMKFLGYDAVRYRNRDGELQHELMDVPYDPHAGEEEIALAEPKGLKSPALFTPWRGALSPAPHFEQQPLPATPEEIHRKQPFTPVLTRGDIDDRTEGLPTDASVRLPEGTLISRTEDGGFRVDGPTGLHEELHRSGMLRRAEADELAARDLRFQNKIPGLPLGPLVGVDTPMRDPIGDAIGGMLHGGWITLPNGTRVHRAPGKAGGGDTFEMYRKGEDTPAESVPATDKASTVAAALRLEGTGAAEHAARPRITNRFYDQTRVRLHQLSEEMMATSQQPTHEVKLVITPHGFGTPEFTNAAGQRERWWVENGRLVRSLDGKRSQEPIQGVERESANTVAKAFTLGDDALKGLLTDNPGEDANQEAGNRLPILWPEHFDLAIELGNPGHRANFGISPGDSAHPEPYFYVGPWAPVTGPEWNAKSFNGALLDWQTVMASDDPAATVREFYDSHLKALQGAPTGLASPSLPGPGQMGDTTKGRYAIIAPNGAVLVSGGDKALIAKFEAPGYGKLVDRGKGAAALASPALPSTGWQNQPHSPPLPGGLLSPPFHQLVMGFKKGWHDVTEPNENQRAKRKERSLNEQPLAPVTGIPDYTGTKLEDVKPAGGSNGARIQADKENNGWLVKTYRGDRDRVATELLSNAIYRELGIEVPNAGSYVAKVPSWRGKGKKETIDTPALAYPLTGGELRRWKGEDDNLAEGFVADALLANWDVVGLGQDNVLWQGDRPVRLDQGGTLEYRAQGQTKPFGPIPTEMWTMNSPKGQAWGRMNITDPLLRSSAGDVAARLTPDRIDTLVNAAPFADEKMRERVRENLNARVAWLDRFAQGKENLPEPAAGPEVGKDFAERDAELTTFPEEDAAMESFARDREAIDTHLRSGDPKEKVGRPMQETISYLDGLLGDKVSTVNEDFNAWIPNANISLTSPEQAEGLKGQWFGDKSFLSADALAGPEGPVSVRLLIPQGAHAIMPSELGADDPQEGRVIMPRNTQIRVTGAHAEGDQIVLDAVVRPSGLYSPATPPDAPQGRVVASGVPSPYAPERNDEGGYDWPPVAPTNYAPAVTAASDAGDGEALWMLLDNAELRVTRAEREISRLDRLAPLDKAGQQRRATLVGERDEQYHLAASASAAATALNDAENQAEYDEQVRLTNERRAAIDPRATQEGTPGGVVNSPSQFQLERQIPVAHGDEYLTLGAYTNRTYAGLNRGLRDGTIPTTNTFVSRMDRIFAKQPPLLGSYVVWRGAVVPRDVKAGDVITDQGYSSASWDEDIARAFVKFPEARTPTDDTRLTRITIPAGAQVIDTKRVSLGNDVAGESEVLLPRGSRFEVTGVSDGHVDMTLIPAKIYDPDSGVDTRSYYSHTENGQIVYDAERKALHDAIIDEFLRQGHTVEGQQEVLFLAGGSGAGKSSHLDQIGAPEGAVHVDADAIKEMLPEFRRLAATGDQDAARLAHEESSDLAKRLLYEAMKRDYNVIYDGTGDGSSGSFRKRIETMQGAGYKTRVAVVNVDLPTALARVEQRWREKGRYVPTEAVRRIHRNVALRFPEIASMPDVSVDVYDNTGPFKKIATKADDGSLQVLDRPAYEGFLNSGHPAPEGLASPALPTLRSDFDPAKVPPVPHFTTPEDDLRKKNIATATKLHDLAVKGDLAGVHGFEIPPSQRMKEYKAALLGAMTGATGPPPAPPTLKPKAATSVAGLEDDPDIEGKAKLVADHLASAYGISTAEPPAKPGKGPNTRINSEGWLKLLSVIDAEAKRLNERWEGITNGVIVDRVMPKGGAAGVTNTDTDLHMRITPYVPAEGMVNVNDFGIPWSTDPTVEGIFRHEFTHYRDWKTEAAYRDALKQTKFVGKNGKPVDTSTWAKQNVSQYAGTMTSEAIAELFSLYTTPGYEPGTLPPRIEAIMEAMGAGTPPPPPEIAEIPGGHLV